MRASGAGGADGGWLGGRTGRRGGACDSESWPDDGLTSVFTA